MIPGHDTEAREVAALVAHLHWVLIGGFLVPVLAAGCHWLPLVSG